MTDNDRAELDDRIAWIEEQALRLLPDADDCLAYLTFVRQALGVPAQDGAYGLVAIRPEHAEWQLGRYASGLYGACTPEQFVERMGRTAPVPTVREYTVTWTIQIDADSPEAAARTAQKWMDDRDTLWEFDVTDVATGETTPVDLSTLDGEE